jgi:hypothetical protein
MESATRSAKAAAVESSTETPTVEATTKTAAVKASSTAPAGETGLGRRERKAEANNLTECCCFHGELYVTG